MGAYGWCLGSFSIMVSQPLVPSPRDRLKVAHRPCQVDVVHLMELGYPLHGTSADKWMYRRFLKLCPHLFSMYNPPRFTNMPKDRSGMKNESTTTVTTALPKRRRRGVVS